MTMEISGQFMLVLLVIEMYLLLRMIQMEMKFLLDREEEINATWDNQLHTIH